MIAFVISPAKRLDFENPPIPSTTTEPSFLEDTRELVGALKNLGPSDIGQLMGISEDLSQLNFHRYQEFSFPFNLENAKPALSVFKGDVYQLMQVDQYGEEEWNYAQEHLRILSGLYGLLKPADLIQPYRLEMGTKFKNDRGADLYSFWDNKITDQLNLLFEDSSDNTLVNVASNEYFKSIRKKGVKAKILSVSFKDDYDGVLKSISFYMKQARGAMVDFAIRNKVTRMEELKAFDGMGYAYSEELSTIGEWVFTR